MDLKHVLLSMEKGRGAISVPTLHQQLKTLPQNSVPGICKLPRPWALHCYKFAVSSPGFLDIVFHHSADSALVSKSQKIWFLYIAQPAHIPAKTEFPRMASCNSSGSTRASRRASQSSTAITEMPFNSANTVGRVRRENRCQAILDCSSIRP